MIELSQVKAAIFDLDDTLLYNGPIDQPAQWLHARSRIAAVHEVGNTHNVQALRDVTEEENSRAFTTAAEHTLIGAVWNIFYMHTLTPNNKVDPASPLFPLAQEIVARKNVLHEDVLREFGVEYPGATKFVKDLAAHGLADHLALATSAIQRDITIFLDKYDLHAALPPEHIISAEKVTRPKPDPECFDLAFRSLNLPDSARRYTLAFEDNPRGMLSAKGAGLYVCAITTRLAADDPALLATKPDAIAGSFAEFAKLLGLPA